MFFVGNKHLLLVIFLSKAIHFHFSLFQKFLHQANVRVSLRSLMKLCIQNKDLKINIILYFTL